MSGALFDSNILIDSLKNFAVARDELKRFEYRWISRISWIEVLAGTSAADRDIAIGFMRNFEIIELEEDIARRAASLRRDRRLKLPDAIIWASAQQYSLLFVTRNSKDFSADDPDVRIPYTI